MTNPQEHTPNSLPATSSQNTFVEDTNFALGNIAKAREVLAKGDHAFETLKKEMEGYTNILRDIFSQAITNKTPLPDIPAIYIEPVVQELISEGVFNCEILKSAHVLFLTRLLAYASVTEGIHEFCFKVPEDSTNLGIKLSAPLSLTIEGDCGNWTGNSMSGGTLTIKGNCGNATGLFMTGGTFVITGEVNGWSTTLSPFNQRNKGKIIHKGKVLWDNGPTEYTPSQ